MHGQGLGKREQHTGEGEARGNSARARVRNEGVAHGQGCGTREQRTGKASEMSGVAMPSQALDEGGTSPR